MAKILLAGESWTAVTQYTKGFDVSHISQMNDGAGDFIAALESREHEVTFLPNHVAGTDFPYEMDELDSFDVVLLSDIGANTLLVPPDVFAGQPRPNRLRLLGDWVEAGGGLGMVGGYLSFQGHAAAANYRNTPLAEVLPVELELGDDREETPEGIAPEPAQHEIVEGLEGPWPALLGFQRLRARPDAEVPVTIGPHPFLVLGRRGSGRTLAYASDIGPHWAPAPFTSWPGFTTLWDRCVRWLAGEPATA
jgi:uncharacterized membrane protein